MPNFSIYLYTCLFLFLTDVFPSSLFSFISLVKFFSVIKIYVQSCTRCVHIAFRLAQCSFCTKLRIHLKRVYTCIHYKHAHTRACARTHTHTHTHMRARARRKIHIYVSRIAPLLFSRTRFSRFTLSLTSLFVSAARSSCISPSSSLENLRRGNARQRDHRWRFPFNGSEIAVVQLRKARPGVFIGVRLALKGGGRRERERRGFVQSSDEIKTVGMKKYWFLFWQVVLDRPFVACATAWATESRYCTSPMILNI